MSRARLPMRSATVPVALSSFGAAAISLINPNFERGYNGQAARTTKGHLEINHLVSISPPVALLPHPFLRR